MDKQPTFRERIALLEDAARCLDNAVAIITAEVEHMAAAEKRFSERRGGAKRKTSR